MRLDVSFREIQVLQDNNDVNLQYIFKYIVNIAFLIVLI